MNNLLFTALCLALLYYCFFYRPTPKKHANPSFKHQQTQTNLVVENKEAQTEPEIENKEELITSLKADIQQKESTIIGLNNSYERLETKKAEQINELRKELELKEADKQEDKKVLESLLKEFKELTEQLC